MINISRVIKEVKELYETRLITEFAPEEMFMVGIRLSDKSVDKIDAFNQELVGTLFMLLDGKHPICEEFKNVEITSIFICSTVGRTIYDSLMYRPNKQKLLLRNDNNRKVLLFRGLKQEDKDKVVNYLSKEIESFAHVFASGVMPPKQEDKSAWGEMPWDFK